MIILDEDSLICDFAETYHIYDYKALPLKLAATLANGLRRDSRIKMALADQTMPLEVFLLAGILDRLSILLGGKDAKLVTDILIPKKEQESYGFETGEQFEAAWAAMG